MSLKIYTSSAFAAIGGFLFGYHTGGITMAAFISNLTNNYNETENKLSSLTNGSIVGVLLFGCFLGSLISGQTSDRFPRKYSIFIFSINFIISASL
jgi:SP family sugar:H+ symporter-like MFS transporter